MRSSYLHFRSLLSKINNKMGIRKEKENQRKKSDKSSELSDRSIKSINCNNKNEQLQCFAPIIGCIRQGYALPKSVSDGGVKMRCTNEKCEYARLLVHTQCFQLLENYLMKVISNLGSARGWTDVQRRHNLWEKKGLPLVQKLLRCKCERGQMIRDTDFYKQNKGGTDLPQQNEISTVFKLKKKKKKELPRLNFSYNSTVSPLNENSEINKKKIIETESQILSAHEDGLEKSSNSIEVASCLPLYSTKLRSGRWRKVLLDSPINNDKQSKAAYITNNSTSSVWENTPATFLPSSIIRSKTSIDLLSSSSWKFKVSQNQNLLNRTSINLGSTSLLSNVVQSSLDSLSTTPSPTNLKVETSSSTIDYQNDKENAEGIENNSMELLKQKSSQNVLFNNNNTTQLNNDQFNKKKLKYYTLFGQNTNFFLGERLLAEHFLPGTGTFS